MKKAALLAMIEALPENADIRLWNGMVGDWMEIGGLVESPMFRLTRETMINLCLMQEKKRRNDMSFEFSPEEIEELKVAHRKNHHFEPNRFVKPEDVADGTYEMKSMYLFDAKKRGLSTWDRAGTMEY